MMAVVFLPSELCWLPAHLLPLFKRRKSVLQLNKARQKRSRLFPSAGLELRLTTTTEETLHSQSPLQQLGVNFAKGTTI